MNRRHFLRNGLWVTAGAIGFPAIVRSQVMPSARRIATRQVFESGSTLNTGLAAYWKLDEASGTRNDSSGNGHNLDDNATVGSAAGKIGNAGSFVNTNVEYLSLSTTALQAQSRITIAAWVNLTSKLGLSSGVVTKNDLYASNQREWELNFWITPNRFQFSVTSNGQGGTLATVNADALGSPNLSTWYFLIAWNDGTNINIQTGAGASLSSITSTAFSSAIYQGTSHVNVGRHTGGGSSTCMNGLIDEVGIWNKELTSDERSELFAAGSGKTCCPFAAP